MNVGQRVRITKGPAKGKTGTITVIIPIPTTPIVPIMMGMDIPNTVIATNWVKVELDDGVETPFASEVIELIDE